MDIFRESLLTVLSGARERGYFVTIVKNANEHSVTLVHNGARKQNKHAVDDDIYNTALLELLGHSRMKHIAISVINTPRSSMSISAICQLIHKVGKVIITDPKSEIHSDTGMKQ